MIMWNILEHKTISKTIAQLPEQVVKKYELWKDLIKLHGPQKLYEFPGFNNEKLVGDRSGQLSSRLNLKYRVLYSIKEDTVTVYVLEITPHKY